MQVPRRSASVSPIDGSPLDDPGYQRAFIVHPRDELKVARDDFSPRPARRRPRRVTYHVEQDTTEDTEDGDDTAFQILDARIHEVDPISDRLADRVTTLCLQEEADRYSHGGVPLS